MHVRNTSWLLCVTTGAVIGLVATVLAATWIHDIPVDDFVFEKPFSIAAGTVSGALIGFLSWNLLDPRRRFSRLATILVAVNGAAWVLYLMSTPRLSTNGTNPIDQQRVERDRQEALWPGRLDLIEPPPSLLAGRLLTWTRLPEKPLGMMAGPAVAFVQTQMVPERYWQTGPNVTESHWIASIAFVVSTGWWVTVAGLSSWLRNVRKQRRSQSSNQPLQPASDH